MKALHISLQKLSLRELRIVGRKLGCASPTTRSRADLTAEILSIASGTQAPNPKSELHAGKGRPAKSEKYSESFGTFLEQICETARQNRLFQMQYAAHKNKPTSELPFHSPNQPREDESLFTRKRRYGFLHRSRTGVCYLMDESFKRQINLGSEEDWSEYRNSTALIVTAQDGDWTVSSVEGMTPEAYRPPLEWKPLSQPLYGAQISGAREFPYGKLIRRYGAFPKTEIKRYLENDKHSALALYCGNRVFPAIQGCPDCVLQEYDEEIMTFQCERARRLAEFGQRVLFIVFGAEADCYERVTTEVSALVGFGAEGGSIALLASDDRPGAGKLK